MTNSVHTICLIFLLILPSCSAYKKVSGDLPTALLEDRDISQALENLPFAHSWIEDQASAKNYKNIHIRKIRADLIDKEQWVNSTSAIIESSEDYIKESELIAEYFRQQLIEKICAFPEGRYKIVENIEPETIVMEAAISEIEFAHPVANIATNFSPIPGTGMVLSAASEPHISFAAAFTDPAENYRLLATVADRRFPPARLIDLNKYTVSSSLREIVANWADELATAIQKGQFSQVEKRGRFSILPW